MNEKSKAVTCSKCGKTNDVEAEIEKSGSDMKVTYTATVTAKWQELH